MIETILGQVCKNRKGKSAAFNLRQIVVKMIDGSNSSIRSFDRLKQDEGHAAHIEVATEEMLSSHMVKGFFRKFVGLKYVLFRKVLKELVLWMKRALTALSKSKRYSTFVMANSVRVSKTISGQ